MFLRDYLGFWETKLNESSVEWRYFRFLDCHLVLMSFSLCLCWDHMWNWWEVREKNIIWASFSRILVFLDFLQFSLISWISKNFFNFVFISWQASTWSSIKCNPEHCYENKPTTKNSSYIKDIQPNIFCLLLSIFIQFLNSFFFPFKWEICLRLSLKKAEKIELFNIEK